MLTVKTYLDRSSLHGIGLFAAETIEVRRQIWEFNPNVDLRYSLAEWQRLKEVLSPPSFASLRRYSYKERGSFILCLDNAQFMNHSAEAANVAQDDLFDRMVASRDIRVGEELLCNYFEYSDGDDMHLAAIRRTG